MTLRSLVQKMATLIPLFAVLSFAPLASDGCRSRDDTVGEELGEAVDEAGDEVEDATD